MRILRITIKSLIVLFLFVQISYQVFSQIHFMGIYGSIDYLFNQTSNNEYPFPFGQIKSLKFTPINSVGWSAGTRFDYTLFSSFFTGTRLGYSFVPLKFNSTENVNIVQDGKVIKDQIISDIKSEHNRLSASIELGYMFSNSISFSIGSAFSVDLLNRVHFKQSLKNNENYQFMNLLNDSTISSDRYSNTLIHPFIRLNIIPANKAFKSNNPNGFVTSFDITYSYPVNSLTNEFNWKYSELLLSFSIGFSFTEMQKPNMIQYDTVYFRDTTVLYDSYITKDSLFLKSTNVTQRVIDADFVWLISEIRQNWVHMILKPKTILHGELDARFIYNDGFETTDCKINYLTNINSWKYIDYTNNSIKPVLKELSDTNTSFLLPVIRFYPRILSEAGLAKLKITLISDQDTIKSIETNKYPIDYIDFDLNQLINNLSLNSQRKLISIILNLVDNDKQNYQANTGTIDFDEIKKENSSIHRSFIIIQPGKITAKELNIILPDEIKIIDCFGDIHESIEKPLKRHLSRFDFKKIRPLDSIKKIIPKNLYQDDLIIFEISE